MILNRRNWLSLAAVSTASAVAARSFPTEPPRIEAPGATAAFRAVVARIAAFGDADLTANGFPGMTIAVRSASGEVARIALGRARLDNGMPVGADQLFQIGSISKSLVAMALFALAQQGRLDLDATALSVVPELPLPDTGITIAQLLNHSAGLPDNTPPFAAVPGGRLWSATPPGAHFSYSNAGYDMLAHVVAKASGRRYDAALADLVLRPLGMASAEPVIRSIDRARYAQGYVPFAGDRSWFAREQLAEGSWLDIDRAAGSVAMTSADMAAYLGFVARLARGDGAPLFGPALAKRFMTPVIADREFAADSRYGNGLAHFALDGAEIAFHTGGMLLFSSAVGVDTASGAGVFASVNFAGTDYRPRAVVKHGIALLRAAAAGKALPADPPVAAPAKVDKAADFAGRYFGPGGAVIDVAVAGDGLALAGGGRLRQAGADRFVAELPPRAAHGLDFVAAPSRRERLWWGGEFYARDAAPTQPAVPPRLAALAGVYGSKDPWIGGAELIARGDTLVAEGAGEIRAAPDGSWRFADPAQITDRLWFEALVGGVPQRLNWSGQPMDRQFV